MKQSRTAVARYIARQTLKGGLAKDFGKEIAAYLLSEHRASEIDSLLRDVQADWARSGYVQAHVTAAHSLSPKLKTDISKQIKRLYPAAKEIKLIENLDPAIIGVIRISLPDEQLDLSIEAKLNKFKRLTTARKD